MALQQEARTIRETMRCVKSRQRVVDHGEVFTPPWLVEAMLDLVKLETERIDSRFLEPACGSGNFLVAILRRKLAAVDLRYGRDHSERRYHALLAVMCIYGIELLGDNVAECRANLLRILAEHFGIDEKDELYRAASYVLSINIIEGDALSMCGHDGQPITVAEWGPLPRARKFARRDFLYSAQTLRSSFGEQDLFHADPSTHPIFTPIRTYPPMTVKELAALDGVNVSVKEQFPHRIRPDVR